MSSLEYQQQSGPIPLVYKKQMFQIHMVDEFILTWLIMQLIGFDLIKTLINIGVN